MQYEAIQERVREWRERIADASSRYGCAQICAVTKTRSAAEINAVWDAGIRIIGENRVQELLQKRDALNPRFKVHLIGSLQTNKVKYIADRIDLVQSLDRDSLATELSERASQCGRIIPALVQVNIGRETQKGGVYEEQLLPFIRHCSQLPGLRIEGLMAIMPQADDVETLRPYFRRMRDWFERLRDVDIENIHMDVLSMGMSEDCIVAAQEGATMVRLGRALFGARPQR